MNHAHVGFVAQVMTIEQGDLLMSSLWLSPFEWSISNLQYHRCGRGRFLPLNPIARKATTMRKEESA